MTVTAVETRAEVDRQKAGGIAALYLALALLGAIPYFLVVVDYPNADTAAGKVELILDHYPSMYAVYLATYVLFGLAVGVLALSLNDRLRAGAPLTSRIATTIGMTWSFALVASGLVFTYGMTTIHDLATTDQAQAISAWQAVEPVALALGGAGGELLGGLWVLLASAAALQSGALSKGLGRLGVMIGLIGLLSVVPPLHDATVVFGLLEIAWLAWIARSLLTVKGTANADRRQARREVLDSRTTEAPR